ncbi:MAG: TolC family protein [Desulfocapsaceae bacterium]|nr:TolC family protein [Desulfocapsaceae bacterium]
MKVFLFTLGFLLVTQTAFSLDLEEMQDLALANREIIKRNIVDFEKSERDIALARAGFYPSVDLIYEANATDDSDSRLSFGTGGSIALQSDRDSTFTGAVSWNIFNGFRDKYQLESSQFLSEVEGFQLEGLKQDIQLNVALRYIAVYERRANLDVAKNNFETLQKIYRDAQNRFDVGLIDKNELLTFKVDLDNSDIQLEQAKADLRKSVNLLAREIGAEMQLEQISFSMFDDVPGKKDLDENRLVMLAERSEILALKRLLDANVMQTKAEKSEYYPKVDLVGSYRNFDDDLINGSGDVNSDEFRAQLNVSINLFQGGATRESVARAQLETRGLEYDLQELIDDLETELQNLHIDFEVNLRNIEVALVGIEQAKENLRVTRLKYSEGLQRESELLDAVANLSRAEFNYVAAVRTVFQTHFNIIRTVEAF